MSTVPLTTWRPLLGVKPPERGIAKRVASTRHSFIERMFLLDPSKFKESTPGALISNVQWTLCDVVGPIGSGKTTLSLTIARTIEEFYESHGLKTYTILAPSLPIALHQTPEDSEVIIYIVDDAPIYHFAAGRVREDVQNVGAFFLMRHLVLLKAPRAKYIVLFFNTQRFKSLDVVFRQAPVIIFKGLLADRDELKKIKKELGYTLFQYLMDITRGIYLDHDTEYYKYYVYKTIWGSKGLIKVPFRKEPKNLVVAGEERLVILHQFINNVTTSEVKVALKTLICYCAQQGVPYSRCVEIIDFLRKETDFKIKDLEIHKIHNSCRGGGSSIGQEEEY